MEELKPWSPTSFSAFKALLSIRLASAVWNGIGDCDETYNYWEPAHFLIYGSGFQTWEYSPVYALRSYAYVALHAFPGFCYAWLLQWNPMLVFFFLRCVLGFVCSLCEVYFYSGILETFGPKCARMTLGFLLISAGMFQAATAFLPSSFAMYLCMVSMGAWFKGVMELAVVATAISALVGWPFAGILGVPIAIDVVLRKRQIDRFVKACIISLVVILLPMVQLDSYMYGKAVIAPWNIIKYNVFGSGSQLYGTEPFSFYLLNGFLNFNFAFFASLIALPIVFYDKATRGKKARADPAAVSFPAWLTLSGFYLWILIFFTQPHKEERFLFPVYPLIALAASMTLESIQNLMLRFNPVPLLNLSKSKSTAISAKWSKLVKAIPGAFLLVFVLLSASRIYALYSGYHGSMQVYMEMGEMARAGEAEKNHHPLVQQAKETTLCLGKEWYRYPSSFFLPYRKWRVGFLRSEFRGLLPKPYAEGFNNATAMIPTDMNDKNKEEVSRYIDESKCDLIIDYDPPGDPCGSAREPCYSRDNSTWSIVYSAPFLDAPHSSQLFRSFYVPYFTPKYCSYGSYNLLAKIPKSPKNP